jgi:hypothetical protein
MASESEDDDNSETYAQRELRARFSKLLEDGHFDGRDMIDDLAEAKKEGHRYFPDEEIELLMSTVGDEKDPPKPPSLPPNRAPGLGSCAGWSLFPIASKVPEPCLTGGKNHFDCQDSECTKMHAFRGRPPNGMTWDGRFRNPETPGGRMWGAWVPIPTETEPDQPAPPKKQRNAKCVSLPQPQMSQ